MQRHQLFESLLSSSASPIADNQLCSNGDENLHRLNRKINSSLQELKSQEKERTQSRWIKILNPDSNFIIIWEIINIILIYIYFLEIPIAITFDDHRNENSAFFQTVNFPVIAIFLTSIFINLNTSFYHDGRLQTNPVLIRKHYIKKRLIFDVITISVILFYELIEIFDIQKDYLKLILLIFFFRVKELLHIENIIVGSFDLNRRVKAIMKLFLLIMKILLVCNVVACSSFFLSHYLFENKVINDPREQMCGQSSYWIIATCEAGVSLYYCSFFVQYIYSLYWAATTMITIGYGDITPKNVYEIGFNLIIQFLSCVVYGYSINVIWGIVQQLNAKQIKIHSRLNTINVYMRDKDIGSDLIHRVNGYLNNYYEAKNLREKQIQAEIIGELTPALKRELYHQSYSILLNHRFFLCISQSVIMAACQHVAQVSIFEAESLSSIWVAPNPRFFYIKRGELRQETGGKAKIALRNQYKGDYVGVYEFIAQSGYLSELTAETYTQAYYLRHKHWRDSLLEEDDENFEYFYLVKERLLLYQQLERVGYSCHFCGLRSHRSQLCFDTSIRNNVLVAYQHSKRSQSHPRRPYARRKFNLNIMEKKTSNKEDKRTRKMSITKGLLDAPSQKGRHSSVLHNLFKGSNYFDDVQSVRKMSEQKIGMKRGGKFLARNKHGQDNDKAIENVQERYANRSEDQNMSDDEVSQILYEEVEIDALANYNEYYPRFNPTELNFKDHRKRATVSRSFYFN